MKPQMNADERGLKIVGNSDIGVYRR